MLEPKEVEVNGRKYIVNAFNPIDAYKFYHEWINAIAYGKQVAELGLKVFGQCIDMSSASPRHLDNQQVFQAVFSEHPEDMMPLEQAAKEALLAPFEMDTKAMS